MQLYLAQLLSQQVPLLREGFTELLLVSDQQRQFADGTVQEVFRTLLHGVAESVRLADQHAPRLLQRTQEHRQTIVAESAVLFFFISKHHLQSLKKKKACYISFFPLHQTVFPTLVFLIFLKASSF